jgi:Domain of unknown function (DUF929)
MATTPTRRDRRARARAARPNRPYVAYVAGAIVLVVALLVVVRLVAGPGQRPPQEAAAPVPPDLMTALTTIPADVFDQVGRGTANGLPIATGAAPSTAAGSPPLVTYIGAEYCPFCAAERWPMIIALSRFGTFDNLKTTTSASDDVYPSTPTFSFYGSTYSSPYLTFDPVELQSNVRAGGSYQSLQTPTPAQQQLIRQFDAPPYVPASSAGAIPFVDFGNRYIISGATYDTGLLQGQTREQIASKLRDPNSAEAKAIVGSANVITATICTLTNDQPNDVCGQPAVAALKGQLPSASAPPPAG